VLTNFRNQIREFAQYAEDCRRQAETAPSDSLTTKDAANSKAVGRILVPTALPCPHMPSSGKAPGVSNRLWERGPHLVSPSCAGTKAAGPTRDHRSVTRPFCGGRPPTLRAVSALELARPEGNTRSRLSRRGYNRIRTCSRLRRNCTVRWCGDSARSSHRGGHSLLPRKLRARPVLPSSQDPSLNR